MHRPAAVTRNGGSKGFIVIYLAEIAPWLPWAKRAGSGQKCPQLEPPSPAMLRNVSQEWSSQPRVSGHWVTTLHSLLPVKKYQLFCIFSFCPLQKFCVLPPLYFRQQLRECAKHWTGEERIMSPNNNLGFHLKDTLFLPTYLSFISH